MMRSMNILRWDFHNTIFQVNQYCLFAFIAVEKEVFYKVAFISSISNDAYIRMCRSISAKSMGIKC